ncbi:MAG: DEAD/DEAH box helicase, partial [Dictyoglomus turgidum]
MTKIEILHDTTFTPDGTGIIRYTVDGKPVETQPLPCFFSGYKYFNPIQTVFAMYYSGGSCLISAPTSAGKTLTGAQFCKKVLTSGCNVIYTAPTQALAREIYTKLKELFSRVYLKLTGYDEEDVRLPSSEAIIVTTYEAVQLGLRNKVSWARNLGGIIIDEFHQILSSRGDIIEEIVAVGLLQGTPMLCLSATLPEPYKVAKWIGVDLFIYSNWRPVPLERIIVDEDLHQIVTHYAMDNAKTIVFVGTKSKGWNVLKMLHRHGYRIINETVPFEKDDHPESTLPFIAFHCADVPLEEQVTIEKKFKTASDFNLLVATHTLAYGVNLPADRVVIAVTKGRDFWPNLIDVLQMEGRAGRLGLKEKGQSIIVPVSADSTRRSKMLNRLNRDLDGCLSTGFIPSLKKKLLEGKNGIEDILHVFLVPFAYFNDKSKHKALIDKFYSLSDVVKNLY